SKAVDPDGDPVTYSLITITVGGHSTAPPSGMTIDPNTGKISWVTGNSQVGGYPIPILADDGRGGQTTQTFTINVITPALGGASLFGSKYDDVNGNGIRDGGSATGTLGPITLNQYGLSTPGSIAFQAVALAYDDAVHA